jgi:type I restriction enzyme S subunit
VNGTIPWVSPKDMKRPIIDDTEDHITLEAIENSSTQLVPPGSVLIVTRSGILKHSLPVAIATREVAINQDLKAITTCEVCEPIFLAAQLRAKSKEILRHCAKASTTVDSIDFVRLKKFPFSLPPVPEQRQIVVKLDSLTGRTARARGELGRIPKLIQKYREAIIAAAFSGELTREWRHVNGLKVPPLSSLGGLVSDIRYGTSKKCHAGGNGIAVLRIPNVLAGKIDPPGWGCPCRQIKR